jgi:predicted secreted hydrolase
MRLVLFMLLFAYAAVDRDHHIVFPEDEGSHPDFRIEWWYATGWLSTSAGAPLGFQVTFFRTRPFSEMANPSAFAPRQIILAHAALADPAEGRLKHAQQSARAGFGLAGAEEGEMNVWIDDWSFRREADRYIARVYSDDFSFELSLQATQAPLLQGERGFSRKGNNPESASHYYSLPQLEVTGVLRRDGNSDHVTGTAWLDHEWSSTLLEPDAVGWDWIGINLEDGAALMAFQIRNANGAEHWAGGTLRTRDGEVRTFGVAEIDFIPLRSWRSPRSGTIYPVEWRVHAGQLDVTLVPLMHDQELDARGTAGALYWEGAVRAYRDGMLLGKGYLEMTGYNAPLRLD